MNPVALHAFNPGPMTGEGNWTWLVPGRVPTLIDAGVGDPRHIDALYEALNGIPLQQVLVTHGHSDHAAGVAAISARMPGVRFLKMAWPDRDSRWPVEWAHVSDGDAIPAGDTSLTAIHTPGHAPDHLCFWHAESRTMFCGDLAMSGSTVYIPSAPSGNVSEYIASVERVAALQPARVLPAHGPPIDDPASLLRAYVRHRMGREAQIIAALREQPTTVDALVNRIYRGLDESLVSRARDTITAHLEKLERDGRAARRDDAWHIIGP